MKGRLRRLTANLALLLVSTTLTCAVLEVVFRHVAPQPLGLRYFSREGLLLHYPGARIRYTRGEFTSTVTINSDGMRDREYPPGKPAGVYRVLVLGDSFTDALQVNDEEVWPKIVEGLLKRRTGGGSGAATSAGDGVARRIEVVNAGLSGQGTADELRYLEVFGARWEPDLVLLAFYCGNDVRDNLSDDRVTFEDGVLDVRRRKPYGWTRFEVKKTRSWLASHSHLYQFLRDRVKPSAWWKSLLESAGLREPSPPDEEDWEDFDDKEIIAVPEPEEILRGWELTRALLDRMSGQARALGARFAVIAIPSRWMVDESFLAEKTGLTNAGNERGFDATLPGRTMTRWADSRHVPLLDLLPVFRERGVDRSYHFETDAHWNQRGHMAAAEEIARFLREKGLVPVDGSDGGSGSR